MNARRRHLNIATTLARVTIIVLAFLLSHDAMMAMTPNHPESDSHHEHIELAVQTEICGSTEGLVSLFPGPQAGPVSVSVSPIAIDRMFALDEALLPNWIDTGQAASDIRIWQQIFLN